MFLFLEQFYALCLKSYVIKMLEFFSPLIFVASVVGLLPSSWGPVLFGTPKQTLSCGHYLPP
jgi:hypothetical protein